MKALSDKVVASGFALALLLLCGVGAGSYLSVKRLVENQQSVEHTHYVLDVLSKISKGMELADQGRRGYFVLRGESELKIWRAGVQETQQAVAKVRQLTIDNSVQQQRLSDVEPLIAERLALLQQFVDLVRQNKLTQTDRDNVSKQNFLLQQKIEPRLYAMDQTERSLLRQRTDATDRTVQQAIAAASIGYSVSFCLLGGVFLLLRQEIRSRKQAEIALQKHAEEVHDLYNHAPCGYHSLDANGIFIRINETELEWLGYTRDEMIDKKTFIELTTAESARIFQERFPKFKEHGWISDVEFELMRKDGTLLPVSLSATTIKDAEGNFVMSRSTLFDISERKRGEAERKQVQAALQQANEQLEARVQERTAELSQVNALLRSELLDRKQAEQALADSENQLRTITDALPVLISYIDANHRYRFNNRAYEQWFGTSRTAIYGQHLSQVLGEAAYQALQPYLERVMTGQTVTYEHRLPYKEGGTRWISAVYIPDFDDQGDVKGCFALVNDITDRKQAEEAVRQSEERLLWIMQNMPVMLNAFDDNWNIIIWNRECERVTGYLADEIVGNPNAMAQLYPDPAYCQRMRDAWAERGNNYRNWEWNLVCKDGSVKTVSWSNISAEFPLSGWATWGIGVDVTDRKRAEAALRKSEQRLSLAIEGSGMATWDIDLITGKALWSAQHFKLLGYEPVPSGEATLDMWRSCAHPDDREWVSQAAERAIQERSLYRSEHRILRADNGQVVWLAAFGRALYTEAGQAVRFLGIILNISDRKEAELALQHAKDGLEAQVQERTAALKQSNDDLQRSNQELEQFAYIASHDLQEPLRAIMGYTQLLTQNYCDRLDDTAQGYSGYIVDGAKRMQQLIQDLLHYSRVGTRDLVFAPADCNEVLEQVLGSLQVAIAESNAIITHDPLPTVTADQIQLAQLLQNLIGNAIKFCREEKPQIHVSVARQDEEWRFGVHDNGIGIKPRYLERIFEIFKRLHTRTEFPGTGIGLAICKKIVDRHHGRIWAESMIGSGTTFYFTLPRHREPQ